MALSRLSPDERKQLKEYANSIREIKKSMVELLKKGGINISDKKTKSYEASRIKTSN